MNNEKIILNKSDNYWIYALGESNVNEFRAYDGPYFVLPNTIFVDYTTFKPGDIIIFVTTHNKTYVFIGFIQIGGKITNNRIKNIRIFKDTNLNTNYVSLKFRLFCHNDVKISDTLKAINVEEMKDNKIFISKYINKREMMKSIPIIYGKSIVKYLIQCNIPQLEDTKTTTPDISAKSSSSTTTTETNEKEEEEETIVNNGMIPIIICPCDNYDICNSKNKIQYFINHYKTCQKCNVTNNNDIELGSIIDKCKFDFHNIIDKKHAYIDPPLSCYFGDQQHEPIDFTDRPFMRVVYINNGHDVYDKCIVISWII